MRKNRTKIRKRINSELYNFDASLENGTVKFQETCGKPTYAKGTQKTSSTHFRIHPINRRVNIL